MTQREKRRTAAFRRNVREKPEHGPPVAQGPPQGGTVEVTCQTSDDGVHAANTKILALKVGTPELTLEGRRRLRPGALPLAAT